MHPSSDRTESGTGWWRDAVHYAIDVRLFADSDGDGIGDLDGVKSRLGYLDLLGIDAIWLTGVALTGMGPNVGDPHEAATVLDSFERLTEEAHELDLRITLDLGADLADLRDAAYRDELGRTLRFWADRGVDGFRLALSDASGDGGTADIEAERETADAARAALAEHPDRMITALTPQGTHSRGLWDVEFGGGLAATDFDAESLRDVVKSEVTSGRENGSRPGWLTTGMGALRQVTRFGGGAMGRSRAEAMALVALALPGLVAIDSGEELGLPGVRRIGESADSASARVPLPWEGTRPPYGFSTAGRSFLPVPNDWSDFTVESQLENPGSTLSLYRQALELRSGRDTSPDSPTMFVSDQVEWYGAPPGCFAFRRGVGGLICALNTSEQAVPLPPGDPVLSNASLDDEKLPPDSAAWLLASW